jgi:hypothetical protein
VVRLPVKIWKVYRPAISGKNPGFPITGPLDPARRIWTAARRIWTAGHCSGPFLDRVKNRGKPPKIPKFRAAAHVLACGSMGHVSLKYSCEKRYECFT